MVKPREDGAPISHVPKREVQRIGEYAAEVMARPYRPLPDGGIARWLRLSVDRMIPARRNWFLTPDEVRNILGVESDVELATLGLKPMNEGKLSAEARYRATEVREVELRMKRGGRNGTA